MNEFINIEEEKEKEIEKKVESSAEEIEEEEDWIQRHLISPEILNQDSIDNFSYNKFRGANLEVVLDSYSSVDAEETVILSDKVSATTL